MSRTSQPLEPDGEEERVVLSRKDARDAARLFHLISEAVDRPRSPRTPPGAPDDHRRLASKARAIIASRQLRHAHFGRAMFGEPAWDMLLLLYADEQEGERLTSTRLAARTGTPPSTTVRWIDYLEKKQLVSRQHHPNDKRIVFITLRDPARRAMEAYLASLPDPVG